MSDFKVIEYNNIETVIFAICSKGTIEQRRVLCEVCSIESTLSMPDLKSYGPTNRQKILMLIEARLIEFADSIGAKATGSMSDLAYTIYENYGGLSILDFTLFLAYCKTRRYKDNFEYINTHGLNSDFLIKWLEKYFDEKETIVHKLTFNSIANQPSQKVVANYGEELKELQALELKAKILRGDYERSLTEDFVVYANNDIDFERPIKSRKAKPYAAKIKFFGYVRDFVAFDNDLAFLVMRDLAAKIEFDFNNLDDDMKHYFEANNTTLESHKVFTLNSLTAELRKNIELFDGVVFLTQSLKGLSQKFKDKSEFAKSLGFVFEKWNDSITNEFLAKKIIYSFEKGYKNYLKDCIEYELHPYEYKYYITMKVLNYIYTISGISLFKGLILKGKG